MDFLRWKGYSRHSTNQGNKNEPKWSRIEESKHELEGRKRRTRRTQHELTNRFLRRTLEDTRRIRDLLPKRVLGSYTNSWISGPLSHKQLEVGKTLNEKMKNGGGEGDGGSLILFNRAITQSQFCPWIKLSQTT
jgi:hypothetical protein